MSLRRYKRRAATTERLHGPICVDSWSVRFSPKFRPTFFLLASVVLRFSILEYDSYGGRHNLVTTGQ
jgi:hypothetical protein